MGIAKQRYSRAARPNPRTTASPCTLILCDYNDVVSRLGRKELLRARDDGYDDPPDSNDDDSSTPYYSHPSIWTSAPSAVTTNSLPTTAWGEAAASSSPTLTGATGASVVTSIITTTLSGTAAGGVPALSTFTSVYTTIPGASQSSGAAATSNSNSSSSDKPSAGAIAGIVIGTLALVALIVVALLFWIFLRRRNRTVQDPSAEKSARHLSGTSDSSTLRDSSVSAPVVEVPGNIAGVAAYKAELPDPNSKSPLSEADSTGIHEVEGDTPTSPTSPTPNPNIPIDGPLRGKEVGISAPPGHPAEIEHEMSECGLVPATPIRGENDTPVPKRGRKSVPGDDERLFSLVSPIDGSEAGTLPPAYTRVQGEVDEENDIISPLMEQDKEASSRWINRYGG